MADKFKRRKFFINKRLQIRYMVSLLIPMLILVVFIGIVMYYSQRNFLRATSREMSQELKDIIVTNTMYVADEPERNAKIVVDIKKNLTKYTEGDGDVSKLLQTAYKILFLGLFVVIIELAFLTIFISHKVAGPIYRLVKFSEDIRAGNFKSRIFLRKGDELAEVASDFNKTGDYLQETYTKLSELTARILAAGSGTGDREKIVILEKEFRQLKEKIQL